MKILVAMSGGVDSSVTAALLRDQGHDVMGATMKLWGGASDSGCCSLSDVEDARRVAQQLGIPHHVFNFGEDFNRSVVEPYVASHAKGNTPNPCVECNRHIKFNRFMQRARQLGYDAVATGHHARIVKQENGKYSLCRGVDRAKDQSYVLHMLTQAELSHCLLPIGEMTKAEVRDYAQRLGLRTASKPDSQDVCFITSDGGRNSFLGERIPLKPGRLVDFASGSEIGQVEAVQLVTVGQRKGMGGGTQNRRYAVEVDVAAGLVKVGDASDLESTSVGLTKISFTEEPLEAGTSVLVQISAHGTPFDGIFQGNHIDFLSPQRRVASGQSVVFYQGDTVLGGAIAS